MEATWREFVRSFGGQVEDLVPRLRTFANADFLFDSLGVVAELKEIETEFSSGKAFSTGFASMMQRVLFEDPSWRPRSHGGSGRFPSWFQNEFVRLFRPPISRLLKKTNRQIRETKAHFGISSASGILILINDGFTTLEPHFVRNLASDLLCSSYSSIDCLPYLTVNRYVEKRGSDLAHLLWLTPYSERAGDSLVSFVDELVSCPSNSPAESGEFFIESRARKNLHMFSETGRSRGARGDYAPTRLLAAYVFPYDPQ